MTRSVFVWAGPVAIGALALAALWAGYHSPLMSLYLDIWVLC